MRTNYRKIDRDIEKLMTKLYSSGEYLMIKNHKINSTDYTEAEYKHKYFLMYCNTFNVLYSCKFKYELLEFLESL